MMIPSQIVWRRLNEENNKNEEIERIKQMINNL